MAKRRTRQLPKQRRRAARRRVTRIRAHAIATVPGVPIEPVTALVPRFSDPRISHPKKAALLAAYAELGNVRRAAAVAGIDRRTHTNWLKDDAVYAEAFADAKEDAVEALEEEARRRAFHGLRRVRFSHTGKPLIDPLTKQPYVEYDYSDTLLIFQLKALKPHVYRDRIEHTGKNGGPIQTQALPVDLADLTDDELAIAEKLLARLAVKKTSDA
jgi:hypothetical protein